MPPDFTRRQALHAGLALAGALWLPQARAACEFYSARLRILQPWTRATGPDDFAIVCMRFEEVTAADRLIGVETPVAAGAQIGGLAARSTVDFAIPAGVDTELDEAGSFVRLTGLHHPLELGRTYPLKLVFEHGGTVSADLDVPYERRG